MTLVGQRTQFYITTVPCKRQVDVYVRWRQHRIALFRPFDDTDGVFVEMFTKTGIEKFFRAGHAVQIEVDDCYHAACEGNFIRLRQRVGRALDPSLVARRMQQGARERGLAGPEVAVQVDRQARRQHLGQVGPEAGGGGFVGQVEVESLHAF